MHSHRKQTDKQTDWQIDRQRQIATDAANNFLKYSRFKAWIKCSLCRDWLPSQHQHRLFNGGTETRRDRKIQREREREREREKERETERKRERERATERTRERQRETERLQRGKQMDREKKTMVSMGGEEGVGGSDRILSGLRRWKGPWQSLQIPRLLMVRST